MTKIIGKWEFVALLNKWLRRFGLVLITEQHLTDLEHQACELTALSAHWYGQESELEECRSERDALKVKIALLNLQDVAETIGYQVHWTREGVGEAFTLMLRDAPLPFRQALDDIEHALEIVLHDAAVTAENEVH